MANIKEDITLKNQFVERLQERCAPARTEIHVTDLTWCLRKAYYRLLFNYIKNKLEAIRVGMVTVENEFMAHIKFSLKDGSSTTLGQNFIQLMTGNKLQNALEYQETQQTPRNVTDEAMVIDQ